MYYRDLTSLVIYSARKAGYRYDSESKTFSPELKEEHKLFRVISGGPVELRRHLFDIEDMWKPCLLFYTVSFLCFLSYLKLNFTDQTIRKTLTPI